MEKNKLTWFHLIPLSLILIGLYFSLNKYYSLQKGQITTICKVVKTEVSGKSPHIKYTYSYNGETIYGSDLYNKKWTKEKGEFYLVRVSISNPKISEIIQNTKPINPLSLIKNGILIKGEITNIQSTFKNYIDIFVKYNRKGRNYTVRTRKHIDSLPCGKIENCNKTKSIPLKVSEKFPILNNLYFESYDRKQELNNIKEKFDIN